MIIRKAFVLVMVMLAIVTMNCANQKNLTEELAVDYNTEHRLEGLWHVNKVEIGEQEMTPKGKWNRLKPNGRFETGNGWLINGDGTWKYNSGGSEITLTNDTGFYDPFGPFDIVSSTDSTMVWSRTEEGQEVSVFYKKIKELPKALPDIATGIWDLESAQRMGEDITQEYDPTGTRFIFLRWDRKYIDFTENGRINGVWNIDAHRPVIDILYYDNEKEFDYWDIVIEEDRMIWTREGYGLVLTFTRMDRFPG